MDLVFNCGGTNTRMGVSPDGEALTETVGFSTLADWDKQMEKLTETAKGLLAGSKPTRVAGGVAGIWTEDKTKLFRSPHLPDWENKPFKKKLEEIFGCRATLQNDTALEGLGEAQMGAGRKKRIVAYLAVGTGIGGVKIEDGTVCSHVFGFEPGYQILDVDGELGFWEYFASGTAMERVYGKKPEDITDAEAWQNETRLLAVGIHNTIVMWAPEIIVLGGGVVQRIDITWLKELVREEMKVLPAIPELVLTQLKEKAGLYGALVSLGSGAGG